MTDCYPFIKSAEECEFIIRDAEVKRQGIKHQQSLVLLKTLARLI